MYTDITTRQGKCVDRRIVDDKKIKAKVAILSVGGEFLADILDVFLDLRIRHDATGVAQALVN